MPLSWTAPHACPAVRWRDPAADPLGALGWSSDCYAELTQILRSLCREQGHERIVSLLEGGYSERGITEGVRRHIEALEKP